MDKSKLASLFYYGLIFLLLIFFAFVFQFITSESKQCMAQPFIYGASKIPDLECSCVKQLSPLCRETIFFNGSVFIIDVNQECKAKNNNLDLSIFNVTPK